MKFLTDSSDLLTYGDQLVAAFERGDLNLNQFDHRKHIYVAWFYLGSFTVEETCNRYIKYLKILLENNNQGNRCDEKMTRDYIIKIAAQIKLHPTNNFDEFMVLCGHELGYKPQTIDLYDFSCSRMPE